MFCSGWYRRLILENRANKNNQMVQKKRKTAIETGVIFERNQMNCPHRVMNSDHLRIQFPLRLTRYNKSRYLRLRSHSRNNAISTKRQPKEGCVCSIPDGKHPEFILLTNIEHRRRESGWCGRGFRWRLCKPRELEGANFFYVNLAWGGT